MEKMDKLAALSYLAINNPVCENCVRGNMEEIRIAAGLYQLVKDIVLGDKETFKQKELETMIRDATTF
ncbi:MAG: hypothetical protein H8D45_20480 [Bacteroidetes bacterium]|nr:hypothetical protein [Bacteroidota bacterium]MBL7104758.1 hypothetical protein [Bacteroidales bacterium]